MNAINTTTLSLMEKVPTGSWLSLSTSLNWLVGYFFSSYLQVALDVFSERVCDACDDASCTRESQVIQNIDPIFFLEKIVCLACSSP